MSEDYNPFLDDSATPNEEDFTHVTAAKNGPGSHTSENGVVSKDSQSENVWILLLCICIALE